MKALFSFCLLLLFGWTGLAQSPAAAPAPVNVTVAKLPYLELQLKLSAIKLAESGYREAQLQMKLLTLQSQKMQEDYTQLNNELRANLVKICGKVDVTSCTPVLELKAAATK